MSLPSLVKENIENILRLYCAEKVPEKYRDELQVDFKIHGNSVTLFEKRPTFRETGKWIEIVVAQFRYDQKNEEWRLYCADRNSRWHIYDLINPNRNFKKLLQEVEADPTGIFWG